MTNENQQSYINPEEIWWVFIYLTPKFLTKEGHIISTILEYGGMIKNKKDLQNKLKKNNINITYQTLHTLFKNLLLKEILVKEIIDKQSFFVINKKYIEEAKQYKERIFTQI
ncbi:MAG: hypothetical protein AABY22_31180 [Nanoarchaeota archaeon]